MHRLQKIECRNLTFILGQTPDFMSADALREGGWIPDEWALITSPRMGFVSGVMQKFCGPLMDHMINLANPGRPLSSMTTEFRPGMDPTQMSVLDELVGTILGYNWCNVGYLCCTPSGRGDKLNSISRIEFVKSRDFLDNWLRTEGYKSLRMGARSRKYGTNLAVGARWVDGILVVVESRDHQDFYQIPAETVKSDVSETINSFGTQIWESKSPLDFLRKVAKVSENTFCYFYCRENVTKKICNEYSESDVLHAGTGNFQRKYLGWYRRFPQPQGTS